MIVGNVSTILEPRITLTLLGRAGAQLQVEGAVDNGFNGSLTLDPTSIAALRLPVLYRQWGMLADGSSHMFNVHEATVIWDGQPRVIEVEALQNDPLVGTQLLRRHELRIELISGGNVWITPQP